VNYQVLGNSNPLQPEGLWFDQHIYTLISFYTKRDSIHTPFDIKNIFVLFTVTSSGAKTVSYPMGTGGFSPGVKRPGREADHSPQYNAEVKNAWSYTSTSPIVFIALCLVKQWILLQGVVLNLTIILPFKWTIYNCVPLFNMLPVFLCAH